MKKTNKGLIYLIAIVLSIMSLNSNCNQSDAGRVQCEDSIQYLEKIGEIEDNFSNDKSTYFKSICDLCCDDKNNLYVADRGWNKIFKFDSNGQYITSFGKEGQGPGEFLAHPGQSVLEMSFGNDKNIYIFDSGNKRLSVFNGEDKFIKSFFLPSALIDKPQINSRGDVYLVSIYGENTINCFDNNFQLKESFLDAKLHFKFPFLKPKRIPNYIRGSHLRKVITKKDHLIALSNFSLTAFHFDQKNKLIDEFKIENEMFLKDFKRHLKNLKKRGSFISPFQMFLDNKENLCLCWHNPSIKNMEIYRYKIDGTFFDLVRFLEKVGPIISADGLGNFYAASDDLSQIRKYRFK